MGEVHLAYLYVASPRVLSSCVRNPCSHHRNAAYSDATMFRRLGTIVMGQ